MIMVHGFNDHVNRYYGFFPYLAERGIAVYGFDQRGWGRSAPNHADKGKTGPTARVLDDLAAFIRTQLPSVEVPVFVLGHSSELISFPCLDKEREKEKKKFRKRGEKWEKKLTELCV
jgi:predicted alpha/beta hydrolase